MKVGLAYFLVCSTATAAPPNIVFVLVDDWGSADAGFREREVHPGTAPQLITPTIDSLAATGVVLDRYYTQHICSPTRSALLSGRYQIHTGLQDGIIQAWARVCLPLGFGTLGDAFTDLGYRTAMVGKWHVGIYRDECLPWNRGFASYYGYLTGSELHYTKVNRIARASAFNQSVTKLYPDLRTQDGPVVSHCITPPLDPPPAPPPPCGLPGEPPCTYTQREGYLAAGHDAVPFANLSLADAEAACDALANCSAITFAAAAADDCKEPPHCKMYLKTSAASTSPAGGGWLTYFRCARDRRVAATAECRTERASDSQPTPISPPPAPCRPEPARPEPSAPQVPSATVCPGRPVVLLDARLHSRGRRRHLDACRPERWRRRETERGQERWWERWRRR